MPFYCLAGTVKTAGNYELLSDVVTLAGKVLLPTTGNYTLYQSVGQPVGYEISTENTYTLIGGFLGVVDETPPTVEFFNPLTASTVSGTIDVVATVFDENGSQWTLYYGPGAAPADDSWSQLNTGSTNVANSNIKSWDASAIAGTYSARLVAVDDRGNAATSTVSFSIVNIVTVQGTIPVHKWVLVSTPIHPDPSDPVSMYGLDYEYKVYWWNPEKELVQDGGRYEYPASLSSGSGYWVKVYYNDMPYSYTGPLADTTADYVVQVKDGWNQIGAPFNRVFPWVDVKVRSGGNIYTLSAAAAMGLVSETMTSFDSDAKSWTQHDTTTQMTVEKGYNVRVYGDMELLFDPVAGTPAAAARSQSRVVRAPFDYRIKISAQSGETADLYNYFGVTQTASNEFDLYDLEEPGKAPGEKYTSLYFPNNGWQARAGRYTNDIRMPLSQEERSWDFNVETNEVGETITLTWDSSVLPTDRYTFTLVNLDTGERIDMAEQNSYTFVAAGGDIAEAHFRIEVRRVGGISLVEKTYKLKPGWSLVSMPLDPEVTGALAQLGDDLPLLNVYQFYDGRFYVAEEADIQAGIGYWIYVSENTEIDLEGMPSASVIRIPLKLGWNILGNPYDIPIAWGDNNIAVESGSTMLTLTQAVSEGIITKEIYRFDGSNYIKQELGSSIEPWTGYFIKAPQECTLIMMNK